MMVDLFAVGIYKEVLFLIEFDRVREPERTVTKKDCETETAALQDFKHSDKYLSESTQRERECRHLDSKLWFRPTHVNIHDFDDINVDVCGDGDGGGVQ